MLYLHDVKIIDLTKSAIDKEKSDKKKGKWVFKDGGKVEYKVKGSTGLGPYYFAWCRSEPLDIKKWRIQLKYDFVTTDDPYFPDGAELDAEGHWTFGDVVLMKSKISDFIARRMHSQERAVREKASMLKKFKDGAKHDGVKPLSDDEAATILGIE